MLERDGGEAPSLARLIGVSPAIRQVKSRIERIAPSYVGVLILGETGTGKELCAGAIVEISGRTPYVAVNCGAIPESLVDSELFGHEKGSFTGAVSKHVGLIARAHGGTLFLDELTEMPLEVQAKLLRTLESGEYRPVGSPNALRSEFRIIAAMSSDLNRVLTSGRIRLDLFHRLGGLVISLPPLRDRAEDIPYLTAEFLGNFRSRSGGGPSSLTPAARMRLASYEWPGNVRELRNVVEAAAATAGSEDRIDDDHIIEVLHRGRAAVERPVTLEEARSRAEERCIALALASCNGNRTAAAKLLGVSEATLYRKLAERRGPEIGPVDSMDSQG